MSKSSHPYFFKGVRPIILFKPSIYTCFKKNSLLSLIHSLNIEFKGLQKDGKRMAKRWQKDGKDGKRMARMAKGWQGWQKDGKKMAKVKIVKIGKIFVVNASLF